MVIMARTYLEHLDPSALRYYYASKLSGGIDDIDLNLDEFITKVNSDLIGKVVNLASRTARWLQSTGLSKTYPDDGGLFDTAAKDSFEIAAAYENCDFARAMRIIMLAADRANAYVDTEQPWKLAKDGPASAEKLQQVASVALNLYRPYAAQSGTTRARRAARRVSKRVFQETDAIAAQHQERDYGRLLMQTG